MRGGMRGAVVECACDFFSSDSRSLKFAHSNHFYGGEVVYDSIA